MLTTIPKQAWNHEVLGRSIAPGKLGDQLGSSPELMVFLRHLG